MTEGQNHKDLTQSVAADQLKAFVERIERLSEERKAIADDISDVYKEAVSNGFDRSAIKEIVRLRAQDADDRQARRSVLELYADALGMRL